MTDQLKMMAILAHPDDETMGAGGTIVKYASEGVKTYLVTATKGEKGRFRREKEPPGPEVVGQVREKELTAAADVLGMEEVSFLNYIDQELDQADPDEIIKKIAGHIRRIKPQVVLTFDPSGAYGHPDHIAISQFATAAVICAADAGFQTEGDHQPHAISKLYYMVWSENKWEFMKSFLQELASTVDGVKRMAHPWPDWQITTRIDASSYWKTVWKAVRCHETQITLYEPLMDLSDKDHETLWGYQEYYRVFSTVNGGRNTEYDLFEGLR